jgi:hypothetical protein
MPLPLTESAITCSSRSPQSVIKRMFSSPTKWFDALFNDAVICIEASHSFKSAIVTFIYILRTAYVPMSSWKFSATEETKRLCDENCDSRSFVVRILCCKLSIEIIRYFPVTIISWKYWVQPPTKIHLILTWVAVTVFILKWQLRMRLQRMET